MIPDIFGASLSAKDRTGVSTDTASIVAVVVPPTISLSPPGVAVPAIVVAAASVAAVEAPTPSVPRNSPVDDTFPD